MVILLLTRTQVLELGPQDLEPHCILILIASSLHDHEDEDAVGEAATDEDGTHEDGTDEA